MILPMHGNCCAIKKISLTVVVFLTTFMFCPHVMHANTGVQCLSPDPARLAAVYGSRETMFFDVSWLGLKAGELVMKLERLGSAEERYLFSLTATSTGLLRVFYPVDDRFETIIKEGSRLPVSYVMLQQEGRRKNIRKTTYDQERGKITYQKNERPLEIYDIEGTSHNEFTAFLILRVLPLVIGEVVMVPTFADRKRHEIRVLVADGGTLDSFVGPVKTIKVQPQLKFKGLYDKKAPPDIWLTDDSLRVPILIRAKIAIGSLEAKLVGYKREKGEQEMEETGGGDQQQE